jgi:hypothetical protein
VVRTTVVMLASVDNRGVNFKEICMRNRANLLLLAALIGGTIMLVLPATASADARVITQTPCVAYANAGANFYSGTGTEVITDTGDVVITCHLTLVYGTPVSEPTRTNPYGPCDILQLPSGQAELNCHYSLL